LFKFLKVQPPVVELAV